MKNFYFTLIVFASSLFSIAQTTPTGGSTEVGVTEGQLSVSLTGGATYALPIAVPPGINGVVPQVSLVYNSQSGNGMAGYGWNISGVSAITRIPSTKFHDGTIDAVDFDALDRFAFDGQRLILKSGTYGMAGAVYETENFSNVKITSYGVHPAGANYGPSYFIVEYPDGSKAQYGNSSDSRSILGWELTYWENPQGVRISYSYISANNNLSIEYIKYGSVATAAAMNQVKFVYKSRQRPEQAYIGGQSIIKNNILSGIQVIGNGIGFRNYDLSYDPQPSIEYEKLQSITEKSGDASKSYNPTVFRYLNTDVITGYNSTTTNFDITNITYQNTKTISGDFNGDGKMDFILTKPGSVDYSLYDNIISGTTTNGLKHNVGYYTEIFASNSISGDETSGYKLLPKQTWTVVSSNATSFKTYTKELDNTINLVSERNVQYDPRTTNYCELNNETMNCDLLETNINTAKQILSGDFNGDGITDVIAIENATVGFCSECSGAYDEYANYMCTPSGNYFITYNSAYFINLDKRETNYIRGIGNLSLPGYCTYQVVDFNGDGKSDIMIIQDKKVSVYSLNDNFQLILLYASGTDIDIVTTRPSFVGDYNGDGKTDFIIPKGYGKNYTKYLSTGITFIKQDFTYEINYYQNDANNIYYIIPNDLNNDGKTDLILAKTSSTSTSGSITFEFYCNKKSGFYFESSTTTGTQTGIKANPIPVFLSSDLPTRDLQICFISNNKIHSFLSQKNFRKELLNSIRTGNGVQEIITYSPLVKDPCTANCQPVYTASEGIENYPNNDISVAPSFQVVSKLEKYSFSVYKKQLFSYYGAVSNVEGVGFLGFRGTMRTNWHDDSTVPISSVSKRDISLRGANIENYSVLYLASPSSSSIPSNFISKSLLTYESELLANKVYKIKNTISQQFNGLDNTNSETTTIYDTYNNPTQSATNIKEGATTVKTTVGNVGYDNQPTGATYYIGRPTSKTQSVTASGDTMISEELYAYTNHLLTQVKKKGNATDYITEDNVHDTFGNITKKTITAPALTPRITNYEYDPSGRFLTKSIDIEGLAITFVYNPNNGLVNSETNPYGLTSAYLYDAWFKKIKTTDYLGKSNSYAYTQSAEKTIVTTTGDDGSGDQEVFDDLGRKMTAGVKDINGNFSNVSYLYDIYDRNVKTSEPYFGSPSQWNETQYDVYGRPTQSISFTGKTVTMGYSGLTTTVNDGTKTKASTKNAIGSVVSITDSPGGTINYTYFANGNLKASDYAGVVITIEQDGWGRKTKLTDPSAGTYLYEYNLFGETTKETAPTPKGITTYKLNDFGKIIEKTIIGDLTNSKTTYTYDAASKLLTTSKFEDLNEGTNSITNTYEYDTSKRLFKTTETTPYATFTKELTFDAFGRRDKETSTAVAGGKTSAKTIKNTYKNGYPWQIVDDVTSQPLWQTNATNARGQLETAAMGNGNIAITNTYDTYGFATQIKHDRVAIAPGNVMILNTVFDPQKGNLTSRTNSLFNWNESFLYDSLDRLTSYTNAQGIVETQTYDDRGRITKNAVGDYNYTTTAKPYQNTSVTLAPEATGYYSNREGIFNDSMESQQGWTIYEPTVITYDNTNAKTGKYSLKINNATTSEKVVHSEKWIAIDNVVDTQYTYSGWIYSNNPQAELFLFMKTVNETGYFTQVDQVTDNTINQWKYVEKTVLVPANIKKLNIRLDNNGQGVIWFDDVKIRKTSNAPLSTTSFSDRQLNITYNTFKSPVQIEETGVDKISFTYNDGNDRSTMFYGGLQGDKLLRQYRKHYSADGTMEIKQNMVTGAIEFVTYIGGDGYSAPLVLKSDGTTQNYLYLHRDYQGSILAITNSIGQVVEKRLFDAWGTIAKVQDGAGNTLNGLTILDRGYTGHEHLQSVGLIHMNGRLYDPKLHRFLQPDNYVQDPSNTQNFNRYGYCINNPLKYTDINGEWFGIDDAIAGVIGGLVNLGVNIWQGNIHNIGQGFAAFGAGAAAGVLSLYGPAGWAAGGAIVGGTNAWLSGTDPVKGALMGGVTGLVGGQLGQWASGAIGNVVVNGIKVTSPILQGTIIGSLSSGATGGVMSFSMSLIGGANLNEAFNAAGQGFSMGLVTGGIAGASAAYANSVKNGVNAFNGKKLDYPSNNGAIKGTEQTITLDKNQVITRFGPESGSYASPEGTSFTQRSLSPEYNVKEIQLNSYKVVKPIPNVESSTIKPYYFQKGMGTQYKLPYNIDYLRTNGYIIKQ